MPDRATSSPPATASQRLPAAIWTLGCVSLLMDVSSESIHSLLPVFLVTTLGASATTVGLIEGVAESTALIVRVFAGALSDYFGRRKPLALAGYALGALSKPLFALAGSPGLALGARFVDRVGKGIRGAPRDALLAGLAPAGLRGAAFGLRQSLDTVGAFLGPLLAMGLMLLWANDFRAVFWTAVIPGVLSVLLLYFGVQEPTDGVRARFVSPIRRDSLRRLTRRYWLIVAVGAALSLARFSEAFLLLRAREGGLPLAFTPLVLIAMNVVFSLSAYPFGRWADRVDRSRLLAMGMALLLVADVLLAVGNGGAWLWGGVALWGLHLGVTQGLLAAMIADVAPPELRGTAYGLYSLVSGAMLLVSSAAAGMLWDWRGAEWSFGCGATLCAITLLALWPGAASGLRESADSPPAARAESH